MSVAHLLFWGLLLGFKMGLILILATPWAGGQGGKPADDSSEVQTILFFGDSLTAGYQLRPSQAFPALIQEKIDSLGWNYRVINGGLSGETSADGLRRIDWLLKNRIDILVLELGANDALRGISLDSTERNLQEIIDKVRGNHPQVRLIIAGMLMPPSLGPDYAKRFKAIFPALAKRNDALLIPFLLEGVAGVPELNLPDGIHPTARGYEIVADNVWKVLRPLLEER